MANPRLPWQIAPSLRPHRLQAVAQVFVRVWAELSELHEPSRGDSAWSIGCRGYSRICHQLAQAAMGEHREWLRVLSDTGLSFLFAIGDVPFKFLRGNPDRTVVRHRVCRSTEEAARQGVLDLFPEPEFVDLLPRFLIETDDLWQVRAVTLIWVDERGVAHHPYPVPLDATMIAPPAPQDLPAPVLGFRRDRGTAAGEGED